ncbi:hypothetical protein EBB07_29140 [Paenibacillaceae bacterium]|nr:hypothetical protein EBB07_29140 [Paenibacillaceae bacterium]
MRQITKIINDYGKLRILHSDEVIDKNIYYHARFDSFYKGYIDYYVNKNVVQLKEVRHSNLNCILYLSTHVFKKDPDRWIELFRNYYRETYGKFRWYQELELEVK